MIRVTSVASAIDTKSVRDMIEALIAGEPSTPTDTPVRGGGRMSAVERLDEIPGVGHLGGYTIIAEIGLDMSRFPTPQHLVSWAKLCPRTIQSGPKQRAGKTGTATLTSKASSARQPPRPRARTPSSVNATAGS